MPGTACYAVDLTIGGPRRASRCGMPRQSAYSRPSSSSGEGCASCTTWHIIQPLFLALPNMFTAGAAHRIGRVLLGQLPFTDWPGFGHYICHDLASRLAGSIPSGCHNAVLAALECNAATCRLIAAAACVRRLPFMLLKSRVVILYSQKVYLKVVPPFIGLIV